MTDSRDQNPTYGHTSGRAADSMMLALDEMQEQRDEARALVRTEQQRYLLETEFLRGVVSVLNASVHRLTAERDEERTLVQTIYLPEIERLQCNLDKEESTSSFLREMLYDEVKQINSWLDEMQEQRDEARREVCALEADTIEDQREYAKQRGWNCFGQNTCKEAHNEETNKDPG
jgi:hypothetical protein